jgi:hypothetical protein
MKRRARLNPWPLHLQPAAGFGLVFLALAFFLMMARPSWPLCCWSKLPTVARADPIEPAPVLDVHPYSSMLNGSYADSSNSVSDLLQTYRNNWRLLHPDEPFEGRLIVHADDDLGIEWLESPLERAERADYTDLMLAVEVRSDWEVEIGVARARLTAGVGRLHLADFDTFGDLARAVLDEERFGPVTLDVRR